MKKLIASTMLLFIFIGVISAEDVIIPNEVVMSSKTTSVFIKGRGKMFNSNQVTKIKAGKTAEVLNSILAQHNKDVDDNVTSWRNDILKLQAKIDAALASKIVGTFETDLTTKDSVSPTEK